jgi:HSP20 family protein
MAAIAKRENGRQPAQAEMTRDNPVYIPRFDIWENDDELVLCGDMPGVTQETLDINFENGELTIHGKVTLRNEQASYLFQEYGIGDSYRTFTIGEAIDSDKIEAALKNGVLTVHLPKSEKVKPRRIAVKTE